MTIKPELACMNPIAITAATFQMMRIKASCSALHHIKCLTAKPDCCVDALHSLPLHQQHTCSLPVSHCNCATCIDTHGVYWQTSLIDFFKILVSSTGAASATIAWLGGSQVELHLKLHAEAACSMQDCPTRLLPQFRHIAGVKAFGLVQL